MSDLIEFWNNEMERLAGSIPEESIRQMQEDLRGGLSFYKERFDRIRQITPPEIDMWHYRDGHNYINFKSSINNFRNICMQGTKYLFDDFRDETLSGQTGATNELIPRVFVNDLVLKLKAKGLSGKPDIHYYYFKNDEELSVLFCSYYERRNSAASIEKTVPFSVLSKDREYYNPGTKTTIEHICSWAIPLDFLYLSLFVGMHGKWMDTSFTDYPIFISWEPDEPYRLFSEDFKKNKNNEDVSLIQEAIETAFGFQRYLISVAEKREKIEVVPDRERNKSLKKPSSEAEMKEYRNSRKSIISLSDAIRIYANDQKSVRQIRKPKKCEYRYSVREHIRHYKNGKAVKIKSYDKNKDLPFRPHKYMV